MPIPPFAESGTHPSYGTGTVRNATDVPHTSRNSNRTGDDFKEIGARAGADRNSTGIVCCWISSCCLILLVVVVFFVVSPFGHPSAEPNYAIDSISIRGINLTSSDDLMISPEFDITISYGNPDENMGLYYYAKGSFISISYSNIILCASGELMPAFHQPKNNVTVLEMVLKCSGIKVTTTIHDYLLRDQRKGKIRFGIDMKMAATRAGIEDVETTARSVLKVYCDIGVDRLAKDSKIISKKQCVVTNKLWRSDYKNKGSEFSENKLARASS